MYEATEYPAEDWCLAVCLACFRGREVQEMAPIVFSVLEF